MESDNKETGLEDKENTNVDEFREYILQQKPANTKIRTQYDLKTWKRFGFGGKR